MSHPSPTFDVTFDFDKDEPAPKKPDADRDSPVLRRYHQMLWSKPLKSGQMFALDAPVVRSRGYLILTDAAGSQLWFGSDAITHSYTYWLRPNDHIVVAA